MQKLLRSRRADREPQSRAGGTPVVQLPGAADRVNRTFVCAVLFADIVDYAKKTVSEQLKLKERFTECIAHAIEDISAEHRIILDTGDGVAINFLDDPEDAFLVALRVGQKVMAAPQETPLEVRLGVNLGPVRLARDAEGQPNIIGDGINVAERVMSFAQTGQFLVSRAYYELVTRACEDYERLFAYQGSRTDKHVREHEIYEFAGPADEALDLASRRRRARAKGRRRLAELAEMTYAGVASLQASWLGNRKLAYTAAALSLTSLLAAIVFQLNSAPDVPLPKPPKPIAAKPEKLEPPTPPPPSPPVVAQAAVVDPPAPEPEKPVSTPPVRKPSHVRKPPTATTKANPNKPKQTAPAPTTTTAAPVERAVQAAPQRGKAVIEERPMLPTVVTPPKPAPAPTALVMFAISPWGEVFLDGKSAGVSPPLSELEIAPGYHRIEIRNGDFKPFRESYELEANQTVRIKYKFKER